MNKKELIKKIILKKEYSQLPVKDVELAFEKFDKDKYSDEEKVKLTRKLLREIFSSFTSQKLLSLKDKDVEWTLRKHLSTRERLFYYESIYQRILKDLDKEVSVIDLGAGVNGFSYNFFKKSGHKVNYLAIEGMKQLVDLMNDYFDTQRGHTQRGHKNLQAGTPRAQESQGGTRPLRGKNLQAGKEKIKGKAIHLSLFELEKVKKEITKMKSPRVIFLFKTIDSLEMLKKDYSKDLISNIGSLADRIVVSFAVKSMGKGTRFRAKRDWIIDFIKENFEMVDDFEIGGERYLVFNK